VLVPIWIAPWELACCQPEAQLNEAWEALALVLGDPEPWWASGAREALTPIQLNLGVVEVEYDHVGSIGGKDLLRIAGLLTVVSEAPVGAQQGTVRGRLRLEAHDEELQLPALKCRGNVRRIQRVPLIYTETKPRHWYPCWQLDPVEVASTVERAERDELLIELEVTPGA